MPREAFAVTRGVACRRCGADEWLRKKKKTARGWGFACGPCNRKSTRARRVDPAYDLWIGARRRAKVRGVPCTITRDDIRAVFPADFRCPVFGTPLRFGKRTSGRASPTLDCIDPARGYTPGNIAVISQRANSLKNSATLNELEQVVQWLRGAVPRSTGSLRDSHS